MNSAWAWVVMVLFLLPTETGGRAGKSWAYPYTNLCMNMYCLVGGMLFEVSGLLLFPSLFVVAAVCLFVCLLLLLLLEFVIFCELFYY